jgi:hypothetical protein
LALVANRADDTVSVLSISGKEVKVVDTVSVSAGGASKEQISSVAITPDGKRALVSKFAAHKVALLTIDGTKVTYTKYDMPTGLWPYNVAITPNGKLAIAGNNGGSGSADGQIDTAAIIDMTMDPPRVIDQVVVGDGPEGLAISPTGAYAVEVILNGANAAHDKFFYHPRSYVSLLKIDGKKVRKVSQTDVGALAEGRRHHHPAPRGRPPDQDRHAQIARASCLDARQHALRPRGLRPVVELAIAELGDEAEDVGLELRILDAVIAADQRHDLAPVEGFADLGAELLRQVGRRHPVGIAVEEERRRDLQRLRQVIEPAGGDPDVAGLVFLDRLERHAGLARQRPLAQAELRAAQAHASADIDVDRMRRVVLVLAGGKHRRSQPLTAARHAHGRPLSRPLQFASVNSNAASRAAGTAMDTHCRLHNSS